MRGRGGGGNGGEWEVGDAFRLVLKREDGMGGGRRGGGGGGARDEVLSEVQMGEVGVAVRQR